MADHRYRLPDAVKERQMQQIRSRFAEYSRGFRSKGRGGNVLLFVAVVVAAYLFFRWRRGF